MARAGQRPALEGSIGSGLLGASGPNGLRLPSLCAADASWLRVALRVRDLEAGVALRVRDLEADLALRVRDLVVGVVRSVRGVLESFRSRPMRSLGERT